MEIVKYFPKKILDLVKYPDHEDRKLQLQNIIENRLLSEEDMKNQLNLTDAEINLISFVRIEVSHKEEIFNEFLENDTFSESVNLNFIK